MAIYVWQGEEPDRVYVVNHKRIRVERRENYESAPVRTRSKTLSNDSGPGRVWSQ